MALAYIKPGVSVSEVISPSFAPLTIDPTSICIVGPAQGYETFSEVVVLSDNHPYTLAAKNPDVSTITVVDASNVTTTPFTATANAIHHDYDVDSSSLSTDGTVAIARSMQTTINDGQGVVVYFENSGSPVQGDGKTDFITLTGTTAAIPTDRAAGTVAGSIIVSKAGVAPTTDVGIAGSGGSTPTIVWKNTAVVLGKFQTVFVDYVISGTQYTDVQYQLNNLTTVALPANAASIVVKTKAAANTAVTAAKYSKGTTTDLDYIVSGSGVTTTIARSAGSTSMGVANDALQVRVSYRATPDDYWLPTRCLSIHDVEDKFGPAFDSQGTLVNPVTFGAGIVFENGAQSVIVQALFSVTNGVNGTPTGTVNDWVDTLIPLRDIEDLNVIVPLIQTGGLTNTDQLNLQILEAVQDHVYFMQAQQNQWIVAIAGEDSTQASRAAKATLRSHAQALAARNPDEAVVLVSPGAFTIPNPVTGLDMPVGGQYAACTVAGTLARYPVQASVGRKLLNSLSSITETRSEADKNADASAGLLVIESKRGRIQVRDAITVSRATRERSELSVVRAKYFMMETLRATIDDQIIEQVILDANGTFSVQLIVEATLNQLVDRGVVISFHSVQARRNPNDPTAVDVRFSYLPAYTLKNVNISFSIDSAQGVVFSDQTAQTQGI